MDCMLLLYREAFHSSETVFIWPGIETPQTAINIVTNDTQPQGNHAHVFSDLYKKFFFFVAESCFRTAPPALCFLRWNSLQSSLIWMTLKDSHLTHLASGVEGELRALTPSLWSNLTDRSISPLIYLVLLLSALSLCSQCICWVICGVLIILNLVRSAQCTVISGFVKLRHVENSHEVPGIHKHAQAKKMAGLFGWWIQDQREKHKGLFIPSDV